jgi:hypothetical protein
MDYITLGPRSRKRYWTLGLVSCHTSDDVFSEARGGLIMVGKTFS